MNWSWFITGWMKGKMAWIMILALVRADLLGVGWRSGCSSLFLSVITGTFVFCPLNILGKCSSLVDCLCDFHTFEHIACIIVGPSFKIPYLYVGLFCPQVGDSVRDNLVKFFRVHFLGGTWYRENQKIFIQFHKLFGKYIEQDISRFLHCLYHRAFLLVKCVDGVKVPK